MSTCLQRSSAAATVAWLESVPTVPSAVRNRTRHRVPRCSTHAIGCSHRDRGHRGVHERFVTDPARPRPLTPPPEQPTTDANHDTGPSRFSPDGRLLAIEGAHSEQVTLWSLTNRSAPRALTTLAFGHEEPPFGDLAFSPDGATLATATTQGHLTLWNVTDPAAPTVSS